jgi:hypothetical protein
VRFLSVFAADLRFAFRMIRRNLVFSSVAILCLALGIGATSAITSLVYALWVDPYPYRDSNRLLNLSFVGREGRPGTMYYSLADYMELAAAVSAHHLLRNPKIIARIKELGGAVAERAVEVATLERSERIALLERRSAALHEIVAERAKSEQMLGVPGGRTGYVVCTHRVAGKQVIREYTVDTPLVKAMLAVEQQCATELGEWLTKTAVDLRSDMPVFDVPADASLEQIREAKEGMKALLEKFRAGSQPKNTVQ